MFIEGRYERRIKRINKGNIIISGNIEWEVL